MAPRGDRCFVGQSRPARLLRGQAFRPRRVFVGKFDCLAVDDAGDILRDHTARHGAVQRLGHRHADDLRIGQFGERNAMPNGAFAEFSAVSRKEMRLYIDRPRFLSGSTAP